MNISILVPTYRRPNDLKRCLDSIKHQSKSVHQLIVTVRDSDQETWDFFSGYDYNGLPLELVKVSIPGVVAALNHGLSVSTGDIVVMTDDDAEAFPNWLEQIEHHFISDPAIGMVGGKDFLYENGVLKEGTCENVGKLLWFGRPIGNHHQGIGSAREVDLLKGVNMAFRKSALGQLKFDERMLGQGAQVHFEMSFCLSIKRAGWKIIYDPNIIVNHFQAPRYDEDQRLLFNSIANYNQVYNETIILLDHFQGIQRFIFILWSIFIGTRAARGLIQALRFLPQEKNVSLKRWQAAMQGRWQAWLDWHEKTQELTTARTFGKG